MGATINICCLSDSDISGIEARIKNLVGNQCQINYASDYISLLNIVTETLPDFFCFYINKASSETLSLCSRAKHEFSSIPAVLITHLHSEALAIWALRTHVWDYFSEPVDPSDFMESVNALLEL